MQGDPRTSESHMAVLDGVQGGLAGAVQERRCGDRFGKETAAHLVGWDGANPIPCTVCNVGETGAFVFASDAPELSVGRRYELVIDMDLDAHRLGDLIGDGCYATVIRTEIIEGEKIGAGLRFDRPLML